MLDPRYHELQQGTGSIQGLGYQRSLDEVTFFLGHLVLAQGHANPWTKGTRGIALSLGPGKYSLEYHDELHRHAGIVEALGTLQLVLGGVQDEICAGKKSVHLYGMLALFDNLKLTENIGVLS